jgi:hypothetical protein
MSDRRKGRAALKMNTFTLKQMAENTAGEILLHNYERYYYYQLATNIVVTESCQVRYLQCLPCRRA